MALNAASHNTPGIKTGPTSGQPPPASEDTVAAIADASKGDLMGQHDAGQDRGDKEVGTKTKSAKELEKERKNAEKLKKFQEKKAKNDAAQASTTTSKNKEKKSKQQTKTENPLTDYEEPTPLGQQKGKSA